LKEAKVIGKKEQLAAGKESLIGEEILLRERHLRYKNFLGIIARKSTKQEGIERDKR
jgi:hypothetical protein